MNQSTASHLSDVLTHIFDHHFISSDGLHSKQTPVVDVRLAESNLFLTELETENGEQNVSSVTFWDAKKLQCLLCLSDSCSCLLFFFKLYKTAHWSKSSIGLFTFSWLNFSRSLSHANEDSKRRCSDLRSEPALVEAWTCAGILIPCRDKMEMPTAG